MFALIPFRKKNQDVVRQLFDPFNDFFNDDLFAPLVGDAHQLRTDIRETEEAYVIESELPGFNKADISVDYTNNYVTIKAVRKQEDEQAGEDQRLIRRERYYGEFVRRFYIQDIDENQIKGKFEDGVLKLMIPKQKRKDSVTQKIEIE